MSEELIVRHTRAEDIPAVIALQGRTYPSIQPWTESRFGHQMDVFTHGPTPTVAAPRLR